MISGEPVGTVIFVDCGFVKRIKFTDTGSRSLREPPNETKRLPEAYAAALDVVL